MIRINQLMMGVSVGVGVMILTIQNGPKLWPSFQLWRNHGIVCERSTVNKPDTAMIARCNIRLIGHRSRCATPLPTASPLIKVEFSGSPPY